MKKAALVLLALLATGASAQSSAEVNGGLQFNFLNPGANSLGMGGAFIGGADDATAAFANPAGLVNIARPEVSIETRMWRNDHVAPFRGHGFGDASQEGADTVDGIEDRRFSNTGRGLAFLSLVYPSDRWAVALYQHDLAHFDSSPENAGIFFRVPGGEDPSAAGRHRPSRSDLRLRIVSRGAAFGFRVTPTISLGLDLSIVDFKLDSRTDRYEFTRFAPPEFTAENVVNAVSQHGDANGYRFGGGVTWDVNSKLRIGAVYRREPSFPVTVTDVDVLQQSSNDCGGRFHVPDVYGVGASFRPTAFLTFNADYNRVRYSELMQDFVTFPRTGPCTTEARAVRFTAQDGNEYHAGARYVIARASPFLRRHPVIATAGWWREAPHAIELNDPLDPDSLLFPTARSEHHYSAGLGILLGDHWQISVGTDVSRRQRIVSISTLSRW